MIVVAALKVIEQITIITGIVTVWLIIVGVVTVLVYIIVGVVIVSVYIIVGVVIVWHVTEEPLIIKDDKVNQLNLHLMLQIWFF